MIKKISVPIITSITSAASFCASNSHVIPMILSIELLTLSLIALLTQIETSNSIAILTMLILIVSEGAAGLTIIIKSANTNGNDLISTTVL